MFTITSHGALGHQPIASSSTVQNHPLGTIVQAYDPVYGGGEFIYLKGVADTVVGSWVNYWHDDGSTALLATSVTAPVAVAMSANVADQYGWYQINGKAVGKAGAGYADNALVWVMAATPGSVDDTDVAGDRVHNAQGASAVGTPSTGLAEFEINRPYTNDETVS